MARRGLPILAVVLALCMVNTTAAPTLAGKSARLPADVPPKALRVGVKPLDPFVTRDGDQYRGFSIDLWNEIARRNGWPTTFVWHETLPSLLADVQSSAVDVGIAGITITREREEALDFSYPMFNSGLEVMTTRAGSSGGWATELASVFTAGIGKYLLALVAALLVAGHLIWLATRRRSGLNYLPGVGEGIYKAAGLGLVGDYGVADPRRPLARAAAVIWSIAGISFVSLFTAALASQLTVRGIENKITGVQDLKAAARVATVADSSAAAYLKAHSIAFTTVGGIDDAYRQLDSGDIDAIVFDAPVLQNRLKSSPSTKEVLVGGVFTHENYGIAVQNGSPLRKKINTALLEMTDDGTYEQIYSRYFGDPATN